MCQEKTKRAETNDCVLTRGRRSDSWQLKPPSKPASCRHDHMLRKLLCVVSVTSEERLHGIQGGQQLEVSFFLLSFFSRLKKKQTSRKKTIFFPCKTRSTLDQCTSDSHSYYYLSFLHKTNEQKRFFLCKTRSTVDQCTSDSRSV